MNRSKLYWSLFLLVCFLTIQLCIQAQALASKQRPNIIVFLVDDMGWMDTSQPFGDSVMMLNRKYRTPNMERLAGQGMLFSAAYVNPVCTPTRTSLITGISAARSHITNWTSVPYDEPSDYPDSILQTPDWNQNGLSLLNTPRTYRPAQLLPALLRGVGYYTLHVGKAHWGSLGTSGADPLNLGFTTNIGGSAQGHPQNYYGIHNFGNEPGKTTYWSVPDLQEFYGEDLFLTEALTRKAIRMLDVPVRAHQPFFLYMAHYAVHTPIMPDPVFVEKYYTLGYDSTEAAYASMIEGMDKSLGDIMDFLDATGIADNTLIIFLSDNGGLSNAGRGGERNTHNKPLRAGKGSVYEGGIRVPMIARWPGKVRAGTRCEQYLNAADDLFPTLLEVAGIVENPKALMDGKSFLPLLNNPSLSDTNRILSWYYPHRWTRNEDEAIAWAAAIRQGNWKLLYRMKERKLELYNLANDIGESEDLSAVYPEKLREMAELMTKDWKEKQVQRPVWKASGQPVLYPDSLLKN